MKNLKSQIITECHKALSDDKTKMDSFVMIMNEEGNMSVDIISLEQGCSLQLIPICTLVQSRKINVDAITTLVNSLWKS